MPRQTPSKVFELAVELAQREDEKREDYWRGDEGEAAVGWAAAGGDEGGIA